MLRCCTKFFCVIAVIIFAIAAIITWIVVPIVLKNAINKNLALDTGNRIYEEWKKGSYPSEHGIYFLTVENVNEVLQGGTPTVKEIGPYVFMHLKTKENVQPDGTRWRYDEKSLLTFNESRSGSLTLNDEITVLNAPFFAILSWAEAKDSTFLSEISANLATVFPEGSGPILRTTVRKLLYAGIEVCSMGSLNVCNALTQDRSFKMLKKDTDDKWKFSFFHKYATNSFQESFSIESGKENTKLGEIKEWNGRRQMNVWQHDSICDEVKGSDGLLFPAFVEKKRTDIFKSDLCKTIPFYYNRKSVGSGRRYEFTTSRDAFPAPSASTNTECYCLKATPGLPNDECVKSGALEMNTCLGSHVVVSAPHFLEADQEYQNGVNGLNPENKKHQSYLVLDYFFGFLMDSKWRVQYNMFSRSIGTITGTERLKTTLFPIFWIDENVEIAPILSDEVLDEFYKYYDIYDAISLPVLCVSGGVALICIVLLICLKCVCK